MRVRQAAISYSKLRDRIGLCAIEVDQDEKTAHPKLAREWNIKQVNETVSDLNRLHTKYQWGTTYIEQETGEYFIAELKQYMPVQVITTQKKVKDPKLLERIKVMDKIEMTEYVRKLQQDHLIVFPKKITKPLQELKEQVSFFAKHTTEAGSIDYYASGEDPDDLVKALMIAVFSVRNLLGVYGYTDHIIGGIPNQGTSGDYGVDEDFRGSDAVDTTWYKNWNELR